VETNKLINVEKNYSKAIQYGLKGIKAAPNYLDFHIALGRSYNFINKKTVPHFISIMSLKKSKI